MVSLSPPFPFLKFSDPCDKRNSSTCLIYWGAAVILIDFVILSPRPTSELASRFHSSSVSFQLLWLFPSFIFFPISAWIQSVHVCPHHLPIDLYCFPWIDFLLFR
ncbi:uncharacterized protein BO96DRAFT_190341 [Aspergillus niger CBS 101883]|uniref:Uncharacterized protein n=1 Tax=Aspergillus niger ATCC 13496 TaxID=1353008 RepID=A0A370C752_ASPNG|nr:uncharacterized protein BO96DRAFT_190341 [Aspergillus niger CBS 101883]PYH51615.1 hypothetical protein BO96DRAFT_190341 [Aspergillus niger CBS 101883]RDH23657.1 hypothetical protein M747DRAFT_154940 [Aspergillus niger ATCC 13496]